MFEVLFATLAFSALACGGQVDHSAQNNSSGGDGGGGNGSSGVSGSSGASGSGLGGESTGGSSGGGADGGSSGTGGISGSSGTAGAAGAPLTCEEQAKKIAGLASQIATKNAATGSVEVNLSSADASCGDPYYFPEDCTKSWRLRMEIPTEFLHPGVYPLLPSSGIFSYLDGQAPGAAQCKNTGDDFMGTLVITEVDPEHLAGAICDNNKIHGSFDAKMCKACQGVGQKCNKDSQCCNQYCNLTSGLCDPLPFRFPCQSAFVFRCVPVFPGDS